MAWTWGDERGVSRAGKSGDAQLYAFVQNGTLHKALRTFSNGGWTTVVDNAATAMTFQLGPGGNATFYWTGLRPGDHYGFITAAPTGCAALGLDAGLSPQLTVS